MVPADLREKLELMTLLRFGVRTFIADAWIVFFSFFLFQGRGIKIGGKAATLPESVCLSLSALSHSTVRRLVASASARPAVALLRIVHRGVPLALFFFL